MERFWKFGEIDTPAVLVDYEKLLANLDDMAGFARAHGVKLRPHAKTHKTAEIARLQIERGAVGITVAKIGEAEALADHGCADILIAYPLIGTPKLERLAALAERIRVAAVIDSLDGAIALSDFFAARNRQIDVYVKIDSGLRRCGRQPGEDAAELARQAARFAGIRLVGLLTHAGHAYGAPTPEILQKIGREEALSLLYTAELLRPEDGVNAREISVGSTPTVKISGTVPGVTEIRPGNYVFYDMTQVRLGVVPIERCALRVVAQVVSRPEADRIVIDAGAKTLALDRGAHGLEGVAGYGYVVGYPQAVIERLSEEHGIVRVVPDDPLRVGDYLEIIPNHACPVVNLADELIVVDRRGIRDRWKVVARGKVR
ncbi:alanine racemase [Effusibacillus pohliae]|uniref:alanine racemase n=1 Tax=Effusibacillus pohliae TaxID=232270 RepID=UPI00037D4ED0|nr:alanine racemase [Effusibacillus pohliae]